MSVSGASTIFIVILLGASALLYFKGNRKMAGYLLVGALAVMAYGLFMAPIRLREACNSGDAMACRKIELNQLDADIRAGQ